MRLRYAIPTIRAKTAKLSQSRIRQITIVLLVAFIGSVLLQRSYAATHAVSVEAESGVTSGNASKLTGQAGASGNSTVQFKAAVTSAGCQGAPMTPGGSDGMGGCFPGAFNTGYPHGLPGDTRTPVTLTNYTGSCTVGTGTTVTIDSKNVNCSSEGLFVYGTLIVRNSFIRGEVYQNSNSAVVNLTDTEVDGLNQLIFPTVGGGKNLTALRVNSHGGQHTFMCYGNCDIQDSWAHDQTEGGTAPHQNGFLSNSGSNYVIRHNSLHCTTNGCTADLAFTADGNTTNAVIDKNLLVASPGSSYCLYPSSSDSKPSAIFTQIKVTNNIFQRGTYKSPEGPYKGQYVCATYGPVYGWDQPNNNPGTNGYQNVWSNNKYDDGTIINP